MRGDGRKECSLPASATHAVGNALERGSNRIALPSRWLRRSLESCDPPTHLAHVGFDEAVLVDIERMLNYQLRDYSRDPLRGQIARGESSPPRTASGRFSAPVLSASRPGNYASACKGPLRS